MSETNEALQMEERKSNITYLSIVDGSLRQKVKEGTNGATRRINKDNVEVWEFIFNRLDGRITNVDIITGDKYGKELHITVMNNGKKYMVQTPADSTYAFGFLRRMPNIDYGKDIILKTSKWFDNEKKKDKFALTISFKHETEIVNGKPKEVLYESAFTKEEPNGLPELEKLTVNAKEQLDSTKRILWLEDYLYKNVVPVLIEHYGQAEAKTTTQTNDEFFEELNKPVELSPEEQRQAEKVRKANEAREQADAVIAKDKTKKAEIAAQTQKILAEQRAGSKEVKTTPASKKAPAKAANKKAPAKSAKAKK